MNTINEKNSKDEMGYRNIILQRHHHLQISDAGTDSVFDEDYFFKKNMIQRNNNIKLERKVELESEK